MELPVNFSIVDGSFRMYYHQPNAIWYVEVLFPVVNQSMPVVDDG